jgi:SAM-dependent methyltransferase
MAIEKSSEAEAFFEFEKSGWGRSIAGYEDAFGSITRQTIEVTLDAAGVGQGTRVLDVCTGPGMLADGAVQRGAVAVGLDFSDEVVALARAEVPSAAFHQGDAQNLPFDDDSFDAVVCGYGVMHVPEPEAVMREMSRVVRPGGRVAVSVWEGLTQHSGFGLVYDAVGAKGSFDVTLPHGPDFFQFGDEERLAAALGETGFNEVTAKRFDQIWHINGADDILHAMETGAVRARALLAAQSEAAFEGIREHLAMAIESMANPDGGYDIPCAAIVGSGVKAA